MRRHRDVHRQRHVTDLVLSDANVHAGLRLDVVDRQNSLVASSVRRVASLHAVVLRSPRVKAPCSTCSVVRTAYLMKVFKYYANIPGTRKVMKYYLNTQILAKY